MKYLVDTCAFLWFTAGSTKLSVRARQTIEDPNHSMYLSTASAWEIAIKYAQKKLILPEPPVEFVPRQLEANGFGHLNVTLHHALLAGELPFLHKDPFDRMLVAQAIVESLPIITSDSMFDSYPPLRIW